MNKQKIAEESVNKMLSNDGFSKYLGIEILKIEPGKATLKMKVRKDMLNGFQVRHGGIPFSLADSALAFASNSHGTLSMSIENNISYVAKILEGDELIAEAEEVSLTNKIGVYNVIVIKSDGSKVALFNGTVYRTNKHLLEE